MKQKDKSFNTRQKILEVSAKLFLEKGYDGTSMRDIVENLGMSKGAIYHQFSSKEEIMKAVYQMQDEQIENQLNELSDDLQGKSGKQKITTLLRDCLLKSEEPEKESDQESISEFMKSGDYILKYMKDNVDKNAPIISGMIEEGNQDNSLSCQYPRETAEVFMLLINIWCDPTIFKADKATVRNRLKFTQAMMKTCGVDVLEEEVISKLVELL